MQEIGSVLTKEGRLISYPNIFQHRICPFSLADPSKPGHQKVLVLFLVDPNTRIISTANIVPQQCDWWPVNEETLERASRLPIELREDIVRRIEQDGFPVGRREAERHRRELTKERNAFLHDFNAVFNSIILDLSGI